ncbi:hypothetical protein GOP47_0010428 [Adiantum capillus-veneris]|uniref:Uncharacterized protein n=1 Tax=Adiantum capillus-veneris TaxID=13818 RepID=A0A9D4ZHS0_ADICA|nr:hypothetical protein GOP47_0010428 [Adiantum capillus-veneris]
MSTSRCKGEHSIGTEESMSRVVIKTPANTEQQIPTDENAICPDNRQSSSDSLARNKMAPFKRAPLLALSLLLLVTFLAAAPPANAQACPCGFPKITDEYDTTKYECCVYGTDTPCTLLCNRGCCP